MTIGPMRTCRTLPFSTNQAGMPLAEVKAQITFVAAPPGPSVREHDDSPLWFSIRQRRVMYVQAIQALIVLFRFPIRDVE